jgi:hypothetical protein
VLVGLLEWGLNQWRDLVVHPRAAPVLLALLAWVPSQLLDLPVV